ncbi:MFS transporter [Rhodanobacter sp. DHB23]|uniref:AmpG family muropeptide MFS transporter n=1 Tax=Rhodanobacter sp. DHB23 TaxID=2775923 RepID=UPI00177A967F|nr:MFS transporter [Rhodanobacter sp. DHB23]MBD8871305.1 MFS transporter [Rhodanobacter sp. DHB23]
MCLLGFSSGLPFLLVSVTLSLWLKENGIALKDVTMIASAGMTYVLKFLWAPLLDHWRLPLFGRLGQRRGWLLLAQLGVTVGLLAMAALTPKQLPLFVAVTLFVAFMGATQDIAIDAYRIEIAPPSAQGALVATYVLGYRLGVLLSGAVALILADHITWSSVYVLMAVAMLVPVTTTLAMREPEIVRVASSNWGNALREGVIDPFVDFFRRYGWYVAGLTLLLILLFKLPEQSIGTIFNPFMRDMGFSKTEIGAVTKIYGVWIGIIGAFAGGAAVARWGAWRSLGGCIVLGAVSNLLYLLLASHPGHLSMLALAISGQSFFEAMLGPPSVAFLSMLVNRQHTATQYALLSSLVNLPGKALGFFAGGIVTVIGYGGYFAITVVSVLPAMLLFACLWRRFDPLAAPSANES